MSNWKNVNFSRKLLSFWATFSTTEKWRWIRVQWRQEPPGPNTKLSKEMQRFQGFTWLIWGLRTVRAPLTSLLKGTAKIISGNPQALDTFDALKWFATSQSLTLHDAVLKFMVVVVDTSESGVGDILSE